MAYAALVVLLLISGCATQPKPSYAPIRIRECGGQGFYLEEDYAQGHGGRPYCHLHLVSQEQPGLYLSRGPVGLGMRNAHPCKDVSCSCK